jgi:hypothetical protein
MAMGSRLKRLNLFPSRRKSFSVFHNKLTGSEINAGNSLKDVGVFPRVQSGQGVKLRTSLHLVSVGAVSAMILESSRDGASYINIATNSSLPIK